MAGGDAEAASPGARPSAKASAGSLSCRELADLLAPTTPMLLTAHDNPTGLPMEAFEALWAQWAHDYPKWVADNVAPFFIPETSPAMMRWGVTLLTTPSPSRSPALARWSKRTSAPR